jgi:hypothetical protein
MSLILAGKFNQPFHQDVVNKKDKKGLLPPIGRSVLMAMNDTRTVLLGVQKKDVHLLSTHQCVVCRPGFTSEQFSFVSQTENLVVLQALNAFFFDGDFPHAGVRVHETSLLLDLESKIQRAIPSATQQDNHAPLFEVLYEFEGLNQLCRLHVATSVMGEETNVLKN